MAAPRTTTLNELGEMIRHLVAASADYATKDDLKTFATKDEVRIIVGDVVDEKLGPISDELLSIRRDLEELKKKADNNAGLTKEIDHGLERIAAIEKHLGLNKQIAA